MRTILTRFFIQKINPTNSWNFALIDYFHDMSLLRNITDNSINFQKASCTLDGCVKIWTSRVESVGTETFKLVSDLASGGSKLFLSRCKLLLGLNNMQRETT